MKILLDTCTFLWIIWDAKELSDAARELYADPANEIHLSTVSCWEISIKHGLGRLPLPAHPLEIVTEQRRKHSIASLPLDEESALRVGSLPPVHRDPFDRMLISQAVTHGMTILTPDPAFRAYAVRTRW